MEEKRNRFGHYGLQHVLYLTCSDRGTVAAAVRNTDVHSGRVKLDSADMNALDAPLSKTGI